MIIRFVGPLATKLGKEIQVKIEKEVPLREVIERVVRLYPQAEDELSDLSFYSISLNGELLKKDELEEIRVKDGDVLILIPAIAGGGRESRIKLVIKKNFDMSTSTYEDFERKYGFFGQLALKMKEKIDDEVRMILDIGCGTGVLGGVFDGPTIVGIDISPDMVRVARKRLHDVLIGDGSRLPFRDGSFDAAVFNAVIFLIPDGGNAIRESLRVVKDKGKVVGTYLVGLFENGKEVIERLGLRHRLPFPRDRVEEVVNEFEGICEKITFSVTKEFVRDFYSIPAMSNALFPKMEPEKRIELARQKLSDLPDEMDFVWGIFSISKVNFTI